jgi:hypothetical protein
MTQTAAQPSKITNARVVDMAKMGLDDDIIIARITHGACDFQLSDPDLLELKKSGVSSKVVAAMLGTVPVTASAAVTEPSAVRFESSSPTANLGKPAIVALVVEIRMDGARAVLSLAEPARRPRRLSRPVTNDVPI